MGLPRSHRFGSCLVPGGEGAGKIRGGGGLRSGLLGKKDGGGSSGNEDQRRKQASWALVSSAGDWTRCWQRSLFI